MQNLWFITNPGSGSATKAKCEAIEAVFEERGLKLAGRTEFPESQIPTVEALDEAKVDTVVLFAGDGTINAALCALAEWEGSFLILPGGTMNLLAKALHEESDPHKIIHAAHEESRRVELPYVIAGAHRAFVGLILGPAAAWAKAREAMRDGEVGRAAKAVAVAWRKTFGRGIRISGVPGLRDGYQAVFVRPVEGELEVSGIDAREWSAMGELGWAYVTGDWVAARAVEQRHSAQLRVMGRKPVLALFDGEPVTLEPGTQVKGGRSRRSFIATRDETPMEKREAA